MLKNVLFKNFLKNIYYIIETLKNISLKNKKNKISNKSLVKL
jgi:hypothetical protein